MIRKKRGIIIFTQLKEINQISKPDIYICICKQIDIHQNGLTEVLETYRSIT